MTSTARPLPAALGESFACAEAIAHEVTRRRLRAADLEVPFRGARLRREDPAGDGDAAAEPLALDGRIRRSLLRTAHAYASVAPSGSFFVGAAALAAHGLPMRSEWASRPLSVAVHPPAHAPRGRGVRGVKISPRMVSVCEVDGLRVADPVTAWALCGSWLSRDQLVVLGDALVCVPRDERGHSHPERRRATLDQLRQAVTVPWRRNRDRLLAALEVIRVGSMSPLETESRLVLTRAGLPEPDLDVEMRADDGRLIGVCDAVYRRQRVVVEVEGGHHRTSDRQWNRDLDKYAALAAAGWEVVRVTSRHIRGSNPQAPHLVRAALERHPQG
ncbi:endonuclease domain-containing protein [Microbacterium memoriense]|uniref:Endonuclease domain-containing protein n=1 Tax=Microbacterium memoriense TaxID=2978350 RepID=A0ABT2PDY0_9MICO|nr:endonuclease domain-containing protein [Microbacterium memoriense]MCT9002817.1 endonuclease domain-containing protein [Microbacterium memoriense]